MKGHFFRLLLVCASLLTLYGCPSVDWNENYDYRGSEPFDLLALHELLSDRPEKLTTLRDTGAFSQLDSLTASNYLFVGDYPYYTTPTIERLLRYVERGNTAYIAAKNLPEDLLFEIFVEGCEEVDGREDAFARDGFFPEVYLDTVTAFRYPSGDSFELVNIRFWEPAPVPLHIIPEDLLCYTEQYQQVLGGMDTAGINFVRLPWGEGNFYVHTSPVFFTNWFVLDSTQYRYPEAMLEVIGEGPIFWDEASRRYRRSAAQHNRDVARDYNGGRNLLNGNETLRYILEHRELAFAWYSLLAGALLYVIFRGKRRQRIVPILPARENSSRRFIDTISRLVHQKGNHQALAQRELASLRFHLMNRFGIRWAEGKSLPDDLPERMGLPIDVTQRAMAQIRLVAAGRPLEDGDLLRFYRAIEPLYLA